MKELIKSKSHDPYHKYPIVEYLTCIEEQHRKFFEYMSNEGYDLYIKLDFLRKKIQDFSKELKKRIKDEDELLAQNSDRNLSVVPKLTTEDIQNIVWKWEGNVMEIIAGNMFKLNVHPFTNKYIFDGMCGNDRNDMGVDGWLRLSSNPKIFIGIQVKFRYEKDIVWNDQISKVLALTTNRNFEMYQNGELTDEEILLYCKTQKRSVLVTTTKLNDMLTQQLKQNGFDLIDEDILLKYIGKRHNINANKLFWENCYRSIL